MTPLQPAPELLSDGTDVARETERALILRALNAIIALRDGVDAGFGKIARELSGHARRIGFLEGRSIDPDSSYNDLRSTLLEAGDTLYRRGKDSHDRLTEDDVKQIAHDFYETAKRASDAKQLGRLKSGGWELALVVLGAIAGLVGGAIASHYGWPH